jgi:hypothetical protein
MIFKSRQELFDFLESYAKERKEEIDRRRLSKDTGLIKSYLIETNPGSSSVLDPIRRLGWVASQIEEDLFAVQNLEGEAGYLEIISDRFLLLHTTAETRSFDKAIRQIVLRSPRLDSAWFPREFFDFIWESVVLPQMPNRFVTFKFEYQSRYERIQGEEEESEDEDEIVEKRSSSMSMTNRTRAIGKVLPQLREVYPDFNAVKMFRIPAQTIRGGYEYWFWGKVTYRAQSFREGRAQLLEIARWYQRVTQEIEANIWFHTERVKVKDGVEFMNLKGAPVFIIFDEPLEMTTFHNFVKSVFGSSRNPFRLCGNPIELGERKVHVYGLDLHLWQRIYLELTPRQFMIIMPQGSCGNTIHRLACNVQRYLSPDAKVYIADQPYESMISRKFLED